MSNEKDKLIDQLFGVIQEKRSVIEKVEKATWLTNCSFIFPSDYVNSNGRVNIQTVSDVNTLIGMCSALMGYEGAWEKACVEMGVNKECSWMGFPVKAWVSDFKTRLNKIQIITKKKELKDLEGRLDKLVSKEKREEMELVAIKKLLGV